MAGSKQEDTLSLGRTIASAQALLSQFTTASPSGTTTAQPIPSPPNALHVVRDSATLLKAHVTKIALLATNKPFTPSAITKVLRELSGTCLPAMMSAAQICEQEKETWGNTMGIEIRTRVKRAFREVEVLLAEVQSIANGHGSVAGGRDSLSATGVVWEACDALIELEKMGIAGLAVKKAEQYRDTIKDAIEELQEWREGGDLDSEGHGDALLDSDDEGVDGDNDSIDDIFNAANSMPKDRPALSELVQDAEGRLKKIVLLYTAIVKRRLKTFVSSGEDHNAHRLDELLQHLTAVPDLIDELAGSFYDLDEKQAKARLERCVTEAQRAGDVAALSWKQGEDEFTAWHKKWKEAVG
jgi:hypothetical protein